MPTANITPQALSAEFSRLLLQELGAKTLAKIARLNRTETHKNVCHSHDFCDANMLMEQAHINLTGKGFDGSDAQLNLWNAAWDAAKAVSFEVK